MDYEFQRMIDQFNWTFVRRFIETFGWAYTGFRRFFCSPAERCISLTLFCLFVFVGHTALILSLLVLVRTMKLVDASHSEYKYRLLATWKYVRYEWWACCDFVLQSHKKIGCFWLIQINNKYKFDCSRTQASLQSNVMGNFYCIVTGGLFG